LRRETSARIVLVPGLQAGGARPELCHPQEISMNVQLISAVADLMEANARLLRMLVDGAEIEDEAVDVADTIAPVIQRTKEKQDARSRWAT
jgi:hypothetical protein